MRKTTMVDEDGNEILPPEPNSPVGQLIYLLEWGRKRGFRIGPTVQIGDVILQVRDLREERQDEPATELTPGSDMDLILRG